MTTSKAKVLLGTVITMDQIYECHPDLMKLHKVLLSIGKKVHNKEKLREILENIMQITEKTLSESKRKKRK